MRTEMEMEDKEVKSFHLEVMNWKTNLQALGVELYFLKKLLASKAFEPTVPNLYELLERFNTKLKDIEKASSVLYEKLHQHENQLGGLMECDTISCDHYYNKNHKKMKYIYKDFCKMFNQQKNEIYKVTANILKQ
ncbi:hypothetical protein [Aquimarina intermedia]|uniref:Uncharacterized protein n=1 Tax=Aquimarina intermedia TaxID=350814 RepID=A0A5S5C4A6_9FLAO|nr:hypothetical protein [Aquimarina intermedia]TYP74251.1 hypothetical protein BD809_10469 [Aquimarina intermedia]